MCCHSIGNNFGSSSSNNSSFRILPPQSILPSQQILPRDIFTSGSIAKIIPIDVVNATLEKLNKESIRIKLLPAPAVVYLIMAMNLWRDVSQLEVLKNVCQGLLLLNPSFGPELFPTREAISLSKIRLGSEVMSHLADEVLKLVAVPETIGAW